MGGFMSTKMNERWRRGGFDFERGRHRAEFTSTAAPRRVYHEDQEQTAFFDWCNQMAAREPRLMLWYAIPNGMHAPGTVYTTKKGEKRRYSPAATRMRAMGLKAGVPDMCWPVAAQGFHGLYIENKIGRNKLSDEQVTWRKLLLDQGYAVHTCFDWAEAAWLAIWYGSINISRGGVQAPRRMLADKDGHNTRCGCGLTI